MTRDLLSPVLEAAIEEVKTRGLVPTRGGRHVLAGPYSWKAGLCHLVEDHMGKHANGKPKAEWCTMECFAAFSCGDNRSYSNIKAARARATSLARTLLDINELLLRDYVGGNGAKVAMRILRSDDDPAVADQLIDKMVEKRDFAAGQVQIARAIVTAKQEHRSAKETATTS